MIIAEEEVADNSESKDLVKELFEKLMIFKEELIDFPSIDEIYVKLDSILDEYQEKLEIDV